MNREQAMLAEKKQSNQAEALTNWRVENRQYQQERNKATKLKHSQAR